MEGTRAIFGGSLVFVALAPALVGVGAAAASPSAATSATPNSLTVSLTREGLFNKSTGERFVGVRLAVPPTQAAHLATYLVDKAGTVAVPVTATAVPVEDNISRCRVPPGPDAKGAMFWCLHLGGVPLATELTGQLSGAGTTLNLTVDARQGFWISPLLVIVLALIAAIVLAAVPGFLDFRIQRARLWAAVSKGSEIKGLDPWVRTRLQGGANAKDLITVVGGLTATAGARATDAREALREALAGFPQDHPLYAIAQAEANSTSLAVSDFVDDDGKPVVHPATRLTDLINQVKGLNGRLDELDESIKTLKDAYAASVGREAETARRAVAAVTTVAGADAAARKVDLAWSVYAETVANPLSRAAGFIEAAAAGPRQAVPGYSTPQPLATTGPPPSLGRAVAGTVIFAMAVIVIAVASVATATYAGKPAFGSVTDYLALTLAAFGSSAAGTVATALAYWHIAGD
jgi:hypothetical protein